MNLNKNSGFVQNQENKNRRYGNRSRYGDSNVIDQTDY